MKFSTKYTQYLQPYQVKNFILKTINADVVAMVKNKGGIIDVAVDIGEMVPVTLYVFDYFIDCKRMDKNNLQVVSNKWQNYMTDIFGKEYKNTLKKFDKGMEL